MSEYKICTKCGIEYLNSSDNFYSQHGKLMTICKSCVKKRSMKNYLKNHEDNKLKMREYYDSNREEIRLKQNKQRIDNPEYVRQRDRDYWNNHKDKKAEKDKRYNEKHLDIIKEKMKLKRQTESYKILHSLRNKRYKSTEKGKMKSLISSQRRRVLKLKLPYNFSSKEWKDCINHFENKCAYCGSEVKLTQDHFIPLSKGGEYTQDNIIPACLSCNSSKRDNEPLEWYRNQPFYLKQREQKILKFLNYKNKIQQLTLI